ncbi:hypothetical protein SAMN04488096_101434 [Mesonia phycicola]|uniref:Uncharacterized protein n=1 Tax=Mesonia phycicola TaxID=579105 RepID=A0A1M6AU53_9FLAO|nr:hypothetical protein SAMN04488096_101434 [Mesonia phycicola]
MLKKARYIIGIPKKTASVLKIKMKGIFSNRNKAKERITNFCSCLFFILNDE